MSDCFEREWRFYVRDMIKFCEKVISYTEGHDLNSFAASGITYDATLRNLELIGEAATRIPHEIREANTHIPWRMIIATRNKLIHGYLAIDDETLWSIICSDVDSLHHNLVQLIK